MKKFLGILVVLSIYHNNVYSSGGNFYTWGVAGHNCETFERILNDYGEDGKVAVQSAIQGFLTGYNLSFPARKQKIINSNSSDFVRETLKEFCKKKGTNGLIFEALIEYHKTLPNRR